VDLLTQAKILLGALPRMLRSIVGGAVASQPDMRLAENGANANLEEAVARSEADVLIVNEQPDRTEASFRPLLLAHPSLKVFVLTQDGRNATVLEFRRARLADASPTTLIEAIRTVLRRAANPEDL
jgi:DNA-binding NarL/FixJ family response regulator